MKKEEFAKWLKENRGQKSNTISSRVANVVRVDAEYNIDKQYAEDECTSLITDFSFTANDVKCGRVPAHNIVINGDYLTGTATLKHAIELYVKFLNETNEGAKIKNSFSGISAVTEQTMFIGNYDAFKRYIGPRCRNMVQYITAPFKKKNNICECEYCHKTAPLDAAHREGMERITIIKEILDKNYKIAEDTYKVDIDEFEKKFIEAQTPIEDHFFFLCKKCHTDYDKTKTITTAMILKERNLIV